MAAIFQLRHYRAGKNMLVSYERPLKAAARYLFGSGNYPVRLRIKTPLGTIEPTLYSRHDMLTVNEIFCRGDYRCGPDVRTIVDFGSNIGLSALYFLTRSPDTFIYLFEPLPQNSERLLRNLHDFEGRYKFSPVAVAVADGDADFGCEETGRYGGIGLAREKTIRVCCRSAKEIVSNVLADRGTIDVLKIDIESFEREVLLNIPTDLLRQIRNIFVEIEPMFTANPLPFTHIFQRYGGVARFHRAAS
ncbi:MAG: FkbM family methyltransferase [Candidatus Micrarchaeaceae archaeon]